MNLRVIPADTTPEAWRVQLEAFRRMTPVRRLDIALEMGDKGRELVVAGVRHRHPDYSPEQVRLAVLRLMQGREIFSMVYPGVDIQV
jgi:hypothetical protein